MMDRYNETPEKSSWVADEVLIYANPRSRTVAFLMFYQGCIVATNLIDVKMWALWASLLAQTKTDV